MANEIKQLWLKGKTLSADVFQPDGSEREFAITPLSENAGTDVSLYTGNCSTIQAGDLIAISDSNNRLIGGGEYKQLVLGVGAGSAIEPAGYVGDYKKGEVVTFSWHTNISLSTNGTIKVYKKDSNDEVAVPTGISDDRDFDSKTGAHRCSIDLAANPSFYIKKRDYLVVLTDAAVYGVAANAIIGIFSIEDRWVNEQYHYGGK
jgi:hypothetical protein